ncbi:hypothetical protein [Pleomorphomonas oryzae]|uniref:hypothetical protein n=1 Tax=Pleomorphomonas oryzae TaxID=261934 RepID=UPI00047A75C2|nr:hypothetical protein [Pleomorphomonas oryzae]
MIEADRPTCGRLCDINSLSWSKTKRAYEEGRIALHVDRRSALKTTFSGTGTGFLIFLLGIAMSAAIVTGIALAAFFAWWWLFVGAAFAILLLGLSHHVTITAIRKAVFLDERLFLVLRDKRIIRFEMR